MADGTASVTRESETVRRETHYYAVRIDTPDGAQVLRVGEDIASIWGLSTDTLPLLCAAMVLILAAATLFSWWLTRRMVQPINHLAEHLDTIEADVPYQELIPWHGPSRPTASCGRTTRRCAGSLPPMSAMS